MIESPKSPENIEGSEDLVTEPAENLDDSYTVDDESEVEEEDFESFEIDSLQEDLVLDDFNDEH